MILRSYLHEDPVIAISYLVGCAGKGVGAVIDPVGAIEPYLRDAERWGIPIRWVVDTHVHADHLSGGPRLADATEAEYMLHESGGGRLLHSPVRDGDRLDVGNVTLEVLHTPGHTPEHLSLLGSDHTRGEEPWFLFTGHTLMVGDMGRTELASSAEEGAEALFESAERLRGLPDHVEILPGAYSGSVCGRGLSGKPSSTIGFERRFNRAFAEPDPASFRELMLRETPPPPPGAARIRALNLGEVPPEDAGSPQGPEDDRAPASRSPAGRTQEEAG